MDAKNLPPPRKQQSTTKSEKEKGKSAAGHTYDKGYSKWESFDVDAALNEVDDEVAFTHSFPPFQFLFF
jgi:hypothetical protein